MMFLLAENIKNDIIANSSSSYWKLFGLILLCAIIIVACYYTTRFIGKKSAGGQGFSQGRNIRAVETFRVTQKQFLQLIKCGDKYFLISISKDNMTLISEINGESLSLEDKTAAHKSFREIISSFSLKKNNTGGFEDDPGNTPSNGSSIRDVIEAVQGNDETVGADAATVTNEAPDADAATVTNEAPDAEETTVTNEAPDADAAVTKSDKTEEPKGS